MRRNEPVAADRHDLAADLATRLTQQRCVLLFIAGLVLLDVGTLVLHEPPRGWTDWVRASGALLLLLGGVLSRRDVHRAQVWLDTHHDGVPSEQATGV